MTTTPYVDNWQTIDEYIKQEIKKIIQEAWVWDYRNFPPYGNGKLPEHLAEHLAEHLKEE